MNIVAMLVVLVILVAIPVALFFGLLWLTMLIWCWRRIGPYFVNFGRWMADWRNLVPCGCMVFLSLILLLVVVPMVLGGAVRTLGLVVLALVVVVCGTFAMIVLTARAIQWFWVGYRRRFWRWMNSILDLLWRRMPETIERMPGIRAEGARPATTQPSLKKQASAGVHPSVQPPSGAPAAKRSWFRSFWALSKFAVTDVGSRVINMSPAFTDCPT